MAAAVIPPRPVALSLPYHAGRTTMRTTCLCLLLLLGEGKEERLIGHSGLDVPGNCEVACQRPPTGIGITKSGQRNEAVQSI